jgi:hypothetical protein
MEQNYKSNIGLGERKGAIHRFPVGASAGYFVLFPITV